MNAELTGIDPSRPVSTDEIQRAEARYTEAILAAIKVRPDAGRFYAAAETMAMAPAEDVCAWGAVSFQAAADLSASDRKIILRSILEAQP